MSYSGIVAKAKTIKRKNPSAAVETHPFPFLDPDYPVKPWIAHSGERFQTVSARLDDGTYLAFILEAPTIRHTAKTRRAAEDAVKQAYPPKKLRNPASIPFDDEEAFMDDEDYRIGEQRKREGKFLTLDQLHAWRDKRRKR